MAVKIVVDCPVQAKEHGVDGQVTPVGIEGRYCILEQTTCIFFKQVFFRLQSITFDMFKELYFILLNVKLLFLAVRRCRTKTFDRICYEKFSLKQL